MPVPFRLLLFGDPRSVTSVALVRAALRAARELGIEVVAIVDAGERPAARTRGARKLAARLVRRLSEPDGPYLQLDRRPLTGWARRARRQRVPTVTPPGRDVNDPAFVESVRRELRPDAALTLMVAQIFERPLLEACGLPANYHNGLLPSYRGLAATAWSVYDGAERSGFSFHRMTEGVDAGPVLLDGSLPVPPGASTATVEHRKTELAVSSMAEALTNLIRRTAGQPQRGEGRLYTAADRAAIQTVEDASALEWAELQRRLLAFELLEIELDGRRCSVSRLRRVSGRPRHPELSFRTADGVLAEASRLRHLPPAAYRAYAALRGRL